MAELKNSPDRAAALENALKQIDLQQQIAVGLPAAIYGIT